MCAPKCELCVPVMGRAAGPDPERVLAFGSWGLIFDAVSRETCSTQSVLFHVKHGKD